MSLAAVEPIDVAARLNRDCHCISVDRLDLEQQLGLDLGEPALSEGLRETHRDLFAPFPVFLSRRHLEAMRTVVRSVLAVAASDGHLERMSARSPHVQAPGRPVEPLLSFDFHLGGEAASETRPQLIEVNTNPGGVLLALYSARAQRACCAEVEALQQGGPRVREVEPLLVDMARAAVGTSPAGTAALAIVDTDPPGQFLYPEMVLYRRLFERHGLRATIVDPSGLRLDGGRLHAPDGPVDGVYDRLTDFYLETPASAVLAAAWRQGLVGLTPDPWSYARLADKRNLALWSEPETLRSWGVDPATLDCLAAALPRTVEVSRAAADDLWAQRRELFFKPSAGYGSRGAYDGRKITRGTFAQLLDSPYVAQRRIPPSERVLVVGDERRPLKVDLRCIVWRGEVVMVLARLYRGQTTNLRTEGGGLATVFVTD